ncbi:hypothetical protein C4K01_1197 [Pseudomonas synxantha]|nr:hypothetical protein C4K01_1197 [Pseudomonas synxantha]
MAVDGGQGFSHRCVCHSAPRRRHFFGAVNMGLLLFCTKTYFLMKGTLFYSRFRWMPSRDFYFMKNYLARWFEGRPSS